MVRALGDKSKDRCNMCNRHKTVLWTRAAGLPVAQRGINALRHHRVLAVLLFGH